MNININDRVDKLEKRITKIEKNLAPQKRAKSKSKPKEDQLTIDLDNLMQKHRERFESGVIFSGLAMPSENPNRLIRWSCSGGFKKEKEVSEFLNSANIHSISKFCTNFSTPEKIEIIKTLIQDGPLTQKEIIESTNISQGQFYHHVKDLINNKMVEKPKKDQYDLSPMGHVISMSFMGIINTFIK